MMVGEVMRAVKRTVEVVKGVWVDGKAKK